VRVEQHDDHFGPETTDEEWIGEIGRRGWIAVTRDARIRYLPLALSVLKVMGDEHGPCHVTPAGRSVFYDLFPKAEADDLVMRSTLLMGLEHWLKQSGLTQTQAAKAPGITQARVSDIKRGKIGQFSLDMLVRLASRAGLKPKVKLAA